ncbi:hypothetical protein DSO57_1004494 [Entomophthora muscae]|uniref:Uncharacterized protein n=1 Tax=Entomophthora muscae TaxID=34485 RepID=A0ACC2UU21_9FUNG|nr:hypothetical protein DSO57_1004494 [Entomophthora muscae]
MASSREISLSFSKGAGKLGCYTFIGQELGGKLICAKIGLDVARAALAKPQAAAASFWLWATPIKGPWVPELVEALNSAPEVPGSNPVAFACLASIFLL